jgi:hypothetical protein
MFKVTMSGKTATVERLLTLPKTGPLPDLEISGSYHLKIDLAGLDPKSKVAIDILRFFPKVLENDLNATRKRHDDPCIKLWVDAGTLIAKGKVTEDQVATAGTKVQAEIVKLWNTFNTKSAKPRAESIMKSLAESTAKKAKVSAKVPTLKLSAEQLKESRVGILAAMLAAATVTIGGGPLTWLLGAIGGVTALTKGYKNAWDISKQRSADAQDNINRIDEGLDAALATLKKLEPSFERLEKAQTEIAASMVVAKAELSKMEKDLKTLEARAKTEKAVKEGAYLAKLRSETQNQAAKIDVLRKALSDQDGLAQSFEVALKAVETAASKVTAKRGGWDKIMAGYSKVSKDSDTFINTVVKVLGQFK